MVSLLWFFLLVAAVLVTVVYVAIGIVNCPRCGRELDPHDHMGLLHNQFCRYCGWGRDGS